MTSRQIKLVENYVRLKVKKVLAEKKSLNENSDINPESIESIESFLADLQNNIQFLKNIIKMNAANKSRIFEKIKVMKHNLGSIEAELNK